MSSQKISITHDPKALTFQNATAGFNFVSM